MIASIKPNGFTCMLLLAVTLVLQACGDEGTGKHGCLNNYGGIARTNSYEHYGTFNTTLLMQREIKAEFDSIAIDRSGAITPPLPITSDYVYIAGSGGAITRSAYNKVQWQSRLDADALPAAGMAADSLENLYVIGTDGALYSFDARGKRRWKQKLFEPRRFTTYSDVLCLPDGIVVACGNGAVVKLDARGSTLWRHTSALQPAKVLAADKDGNIVVPLSNNRFGATDSVLLLSAAGEYRWARAFEETRLLKNPVITGRHILIAGIRSAGDSRIAVLHALDKQGRVEWSRELPMTPRGISAARDGSIYICGYDTGVGQALSSVVALDAEGREQWRQHYELKIPAALLISEEILAFVGIKEKSTGLYYIKRDGSYSEHTSLSDVPILHLQADVGSNGDIIFASSEKLALIAVGESAVHKILPY